jgi:hypothetical protein
VDAIRTGCHVIDPIKVAEQNELAEYFGRAVII